MPLALNGSGITNGIAIGYAHIMRQGVGDIARFDIAPEDLDNEVRRYLAAVELAISQLHTIRADIPKHIPKDVAAFIDTYLLMLDDDALKTGPVHHIQEQHCNAEWALQIQCSAIESVFQEMQDPYLKTRIDDINHVVNRIQRILAISEDSDRTETILPAQTIIIADDLSPAETLTFLHDQVAGIVLQGCAPTSHTAILVRSLGIPTIIGVDHALQLLQEREPVVIDARKGVILAGLDIEQTAHYRLLLRREKAAAQTALRSVRLASVTLDGIKVALRANLELPHDLKLAQTMHAAGVGLYRTEFLYLGGLVASEADQLRAYSRVLKAMPRQPVTIRTLDIGADKNFEDAATTSNSALGLRAIRLCLKDQAMFKVQLRAIHRAAVYGQTRILLPMVTALPEIQDVKRLIRECVAELARKGIKHKSRLPLGCMIETPAAALTAAQLAPHIDFFSIGTNDLIQYTLAVDRTESSVNYLYDNCHPAVLGLLDHVLKVGTRTGKSVALCGEMAGDPFFTRFLLAIGLREFSLHPINLPEIKNIIRTSKVSGMQRMARRIINAASPQEARFLIRTLNAS